MRRTALYFAFSLLSLSGCANNPSAPAASQEILEPDMAAAQEASPADRRADLMYQLLVGEVAGQRSQLPLSVAAYQRAAQMSDDPAVAQRAARIALFAQDFTAARQAAERWRELEPDNPEVLQLLAILRIQQGEAEQALDDLDAVVQSQADPQTGFQQAGVILGRELAPDEAVRIMQMLVARHDDNPDAHYALARLALATDHNAVAREALERVLQLDPERHNARAIYAGVLFELGEIDAAIVAMEKALQAMPEQHELRLNYARLLVQAERVAKAREQFRVLVEDKPDDASLVYTNALLAIQLEEVDEARKLLEHLLELGEYTDEANFYLARLAEEEGEYNRARAYYEQVIGDELGLDAAIRIADLYYMEGKKGKARELLNALFVRYRDNDSQVRLHLVSAEWLRQEGRFGDAMAVYDEALEALPGNVDLLYARALTAEKAGRPEILERDLRAVLEADPDNPNALNALGYTLADQGERLQEAREYIERALSLMPDDPAVLDSMGWVLYRLGEPEKALPYLQRAFERLVDPEIAAHLGEVLWQLGRRGEARELWQGVLETYPEAEVLQETMQRLMQ